MFCASKFTAFTTFYSVLKNCANNAQSLAVFSVKNQFHFISCKTVDNSPQSMFEMLTLQLSHKLKVFCEAQYVLTES